jgi:hypothetical protein
MPTRNETKQFKMLSEEALAKFKIFCAAGKYPRPAGAYDAAIAQEYEAPDDEISERLMQLLEGMKATMKPDDYSKAEIAVGEIRKLSQQRIADHHAALNEASSNVTGGARDSRRSFDWARDWATGKGLSAADAEEFVTGLQQHGGGNPPTRAQDRARKIASDARMIAASGNRASFDARYPNAQRMEPSSRESVSALRGHLKRIGVV